MTKIACSERGFVHECGNNLDVAEIKANRPSKLWGSKGYSLYYVPAAVDAGADIPANSCMALMQKPTMQKGKLLLRERWENR